MVKSIKIFFLETLPFLVGFLMGFNPLDVTRPLSGCVRLPQGRDAEASFLRNCGICGKFERTRGHDSKTHPSSQLFFLGTYVYNMMQHNNIYICEYIYIYILISYDIDYEHIWRYFVPWPALLDSKAAQPNGQGRSKRGGSVKVLRWGS